MNTTSMLNKNEFNALITHIGVDAVISSYHFLQGMMLSIASAPRALPSLEWFALAFEANSEQDGEVDALIDLINNESVLPLFEHLEAVGHYWTQLIAAHDIDSLPLHPDYHIDDNNEPSTALREFCDGVLAGHIYFEGEWETVINDPEIGAEIAAATHAALIYAMVIASSPEERAEMLLDMDVPEEEAGKFMAESLEQLPEGLYIRGSLGFALASAGHLEPADGDDESNGNDDTEYTEFEDLPEPYRPLGKPVGRNKPCPCGSGKKYKKCCLQ